MSKLSAHATISKPSLPVMRQTWNSQATARAAQWETFANINKKKKRPEWQLMPQLSTRARLPFLKLQTSAYPQIFLCFMATAKTNFPPPPGMSDGAERSDQLPHSEDQTQSQLLLECITGPGLAQTWKESLELFWTNLENWEPVKTNIYRAFSNIRDLEEDSKDNSNTDWDNDPSKDIILDSPALGEFSSQNYFLPHSRRRMPVMDPHCSLQPSLQHTMAFSRTRSLRTPPHLAPLFCIQISLNQKITKIQPSPMDTVV